MLGDFHRGVCVVSRYLLLEGKVESYLRYPNGRDTSLAEIPMAENPFSLNSVDFFSCPNFGSLSL